MHKTPKAHGEKQASLFHNFKRLETSFYVEWGQLKTLNKVYLLFIQLPFPGVRQDGQSRDAPPGYGSRNFLLSLRLAPRFSPGKGTGAQTSLFQLRRHLCLRQDLRLITPYRLICIANTEAPIMHLGQDSSRNTI